MNFFTIGVYGFNEKDFFQILMDNKIDTFCDIRQRRIVRGSKYAFANSNKLQQKLNEINIQYYHIINLAPTKEIREIQKIEDEKNNILKRERTQLCQRFREEYINKILHKFNFNDFLKQLEEKYAKNIVLFCVEKDYNACHRSIVAYELQKLGFNVKHL